MKRKLASDDEEIIPFSIRRFWDVNECGPPCCPRDLILQTTGDRFLHLESWNLLPASDELGRDCVVRRAPASKTLLMFEATGETVRAEQDSVREVLFDFTAAECDWVDVTDLPVEFRRIAGIE